MIFLGVEVNMSKNIEVNFPINFPIFPMAAIWYSRFWSNWIQNSEL